MNRGGVVRIGGESIIPWGESIIISESVNTPSLPSECGMPGESNASTSGVKDCAARPTIGRLNVGLNLGKSIKISGIKSPDMLSSDS